MMPVLIQGPRQPGNDIDVYIRPLVEELLQLWREEGVPIWDEHKQKEYIPIIKGEEFLFSPFFEFCLDALFL
jgi:hypothetical protein